MTCRIYPFLCQAVINCIDRAYQCNLEELIKRKDVMIAFHGVSVEFA